MTLPRFVALACALVPAVAIQQKPPKKGPLTWQKLGSGCTQRFAHVAVWNSRDAAFLLFAGERSGGSGFDFHDDLWEYRPKENAWKKLEPAGAKPPMRAYHAAAFDSKQNAMWVFGGCDGRF
ncbi:MAG TPA: kelch repeat-containing protein, partial [Planctomycetota bacterium]|nr:kelch repeat-containing protein [Planctomycetota bacterium]